MHSITVVGRDNGNKGYETVLLYDLVVDDLEHETVLAAFIEQREEDMEGLDDDEREEIEVLFAFEGPAKIAADYRG